MKIFPLKSGSPEVSLGISIQTTWPFILYLNRNWYSPSSGNAAFISLSLISSCPKLILHFLFFSYFKHLMPAFTRMRLELQGRPYLQEHSKE